MPIFVSYRRGNDSAVAGRLHSALVSRFGAAASFLDTRSIGAGDDYPTELRHALQTCTALGRGIPVVPVLIDDARALKATDLGPALRPLAARQAVRIRHSSWDRDVGALTDVLAAYVPPTPRDAPLTDEQLGYFRAAVTATITRSIGSKYIPSLYVQRSAVQQRLLTHARGPSAPGVLGEAERRLRECAEALRDVDRRIARREDAEARAQDAARAAHAAARAAAEPTADVRAAEADVRATTAAATEWLREIRTRIDELTALTDQYVNAVAGTPLLRKDHLVWQHRVEAAVQLLSQGDSTPPKAPDDHLDRAVVQTALRRVERLGAAVSRVADSCRPLMTVVEKAGRGKTNLLCDFALRMAGTTPTVFLAARTLGTGPGALTDAIDAIIEANRGLGARTLADLSAQRRTRQIVVCIDGINEAPRPAEFAGYFADFLDACHRDDIRVIATCRDEYWPLFVRQLESHSTRCFSGSSARPTAGGGSSRGVRSGRSGSCRCSRSPARCPAATPRPATRPTG